MLSYIKKTLRSFVYNKDRFQKFLFLSGTVFNFHTYCYFQNNSEILRSIMSSIVVLLSLVSITWCYNISFRYEISFDFIFFIIGSVLTLQFFTNHLIIGFSCIVTMVSYTYVKSRKLSVDYYEENSINDHNKTIIFSEYEYTGNIAVNFFIPWQYLGNYIHHQNFSYQKRRNRPSIIHYDCLGLALSLEYARQTGLLNVNLLSTIISTATGESCVAKSVYFRTPGVCAVNYEVLRQLDSRPCLSYFKFWHYLTFHHQLTICKNHPKNHLSPKKFDNSRKVHGLMFLFKGLDYFSPKKLEEIRSESNFEIKLEAMDYQSRLRKLNDFIDKRKESNNRERLRKYLTCVVNWYHGRNCKIHVTPEYRIRWKKHVDWIIGSDRIILEYKVKTFNKEHPLRTKHDSSEPIIELPNIKEEKEKIFKSRVTDLTDSSDRVREMNINHNKDTINTFKTLDRVQLEDNVHSEDIIEEYKCKAIAEKRCIEIKRPNLRQSKFELHAKCGPCGTDHKFNLLNEYDRRNFNKNKDPNQVGLDYENKTSEWILIHKTSKYTENYIPKNPFKNSFGLLKECNLSQFAYPKTDNMPLYLSPDINDIKKHKEIKEKQKKKSKKNVERNIINHSERSNRSFNKLKNNVNKIFREAIPRNRMNTSDIYSRGSNLGKKLDLSKPIQGNIKIVPVSECIFFRMKQFKFNNYETTVMNIVCNSFLLKFKNDIFWKFYRSLFQ